MTLNLQSVDPSGPCPHWLHPAETSAFVEHVRRHLRGNGAHGVVYAPVEAWELDEPERVHRRRVQAWRRALKTPLHRTNWRRALVVRDPGLLLAEAQARPDGGLVGHLDLRGGETPADLHRCTLAMGLEPAFRGRGLGRLLLLEAVRWARAQPGLAWVDLSVFSHNHAALHLYRRAGFVEVGRVADRFRVLGAEIDDVGMVLRLR
ncbi:MAG: N-acetyltransferase [Myxococcales bacterium]|nr:N-acetyltransferase [Myxococcales bacterium]